MEAGLGSDWPERFVLGIETSCDETSASVVCGRRVLSNVVSSQADLHAKWGGVVPEAAAREHVAAILPVIAEALAVLADSTSTAPAGHLPLTPRGRKEIDAALKRISGIAVTNRPGLVGALSVGVTAAKGLALSLNIPLVGVNHLEGHLASVYAQEPLIAFPYVALIVSGGHTELILVKALGEYEHLGGTIDDAAGEAFDKAARLLGLGYPGGLQVQQKATTGNPTRYALPKGLKGDTLNFSFSGLKSAVMRLVENEGANLNVEDCCASLQHTIVETLVERTMSAAERHEVSAVSVVGGVSANQLLRKRMEQECTRRGLNFRVPPFELCTDNAAMIALAGAWRLARGQSDGFDMDVEATGPL